MPVLCTEGCGNLARCSGSEYIRSSHNYMYFYDCSAGHRVIQLREKFGTVSLNANFQLGLETSIGGGLLMADTKAMSLNEIRDRRKEVDEETHEAMVAGKQTARPPCPTCIHDDFVSNKLKDMKEYVGRMTMLNKRGKAVIKGNIEGNVSSPLRGKIVSYDVEFTCDRNHGLTLNYTPEEYDKMFKGQKVEVQEVMPRGA